MATPYSEFSFRHDDFHIDGLFNVIDELLIEASTGLRGFKIESVRRMADEINAVAVPTFIADYIAAWALTDAGKAKLQEAYDEHMADSERDPLHDEDHPDNRYPLWRAA